MASGDLGVSRVRRRRAFAWPYGGTRGVAMTLRASEGRGVCGQDGRQRRGRAGLAFGAFRRHLRSSLLLSDCAVCRPERTPDDQNAGLRLTWRHALGFGAPTIFASCLSPADFRANRGLTVSCCRRQMFTDTRGSRLTMPMCLQMGLRWCLALVDGPWLASGSSCELLPLAADATGAQAWRPKRRLAAALAICA